MVNSIIDLFIDSFYLLVDEIFMPLFYYYDLIELILGIFLTFCFYRFLISPLFNGSTGFGKFFAGGSDRARKKEE